MISFLQTIIIFLINGTSVLRFYQIKDYIYKRVIAQFYFPSSKKIIFNKKEYFIYLLILLSLFFINNIHFLIRTDFLIFLISIFLLFRVSLIKKIHFTLKAVFILLFSSIFNFYILQISSNNLTVFFILCLWPVQFYVYTLSIKIFNLIIKPYLQILAYQVKIKISKIKQINPYFKIIGICGSYGKSSTKEILIELLKQKYKVLSPPARINHEYALIKFLLKTKIENYDYLILEFGSYYLGNIKWISKFLTPEVVYITGITKQHLFLFGSIEKIIEGEGLEILTWMKKGIVFINNNHEYFQIFEEKYEKLKTPEIKDYFYGKNYKILDINIDEKTAFFEFNQQTFQTNLIFPMQIENLVGALSYIALIDNLEDYREKIKNIDLPEGFLKLKITDISGLKHGLRWTLFSKLNEPEKDETINVSSKSVFYIFNDSYNANPKGVFDSLDFFKKLNFNFKIIVFNGLLELGKETKNVYQDLAKEFSAFNEIILTSSDFIEIFKEVLKDKFLVVKNSKELEIFLQSLKFKKVGIWIFNRFPSSFENNLYLKE
jgi:UDP-N-acetylmuramoyl-tripeptide--D-alanyl-D-alanine ligase